MILPPPLFTALELRATTLDRALPLIGRRFGVTMRAMPAIGGEIAIVRLDRGDLEATKTHLADAFSGEWRTDRDGTLVLSPSRARRDADYRRWKDRRREPVRGGLARYAERLRRLPRFDTTLARRLIAQEKGPSSRSATEVEIADPGERLQIRLLGRMRTEEILSETLGYGAPFGRIVYASDPVGAEVGLGRLGPELLRTYREESALLERLQPPDDYANLHKCSLATGFTLDVSQDENGVRATLEVETENDGRREVEYETFDSLAEDRDRNPPIPYELAVDLPDENRWFERLPEDPLAGAFSEAVLDAARRAGRSTVVATSDLWIGTNWPPRGDLTEVFRPGRGVPTASRAIFDADGWLSATTDDPYLRRARFFPRRDVASLVRVLRSDATLGQLLDTYRLRPAWPLATPVESSLIQALPYERSAAVPNDLRLLAALTPSEWRAAERGPVLVADLSEPARTHAYDILYGNRFGGDYSLACGKPGGDPITVDPSEATLSLRREEGAVAEIYENGRPYYRIVGSDFRWWMAVDPDAEDPDHRPIFRQTRWTMLLGSGDLRRTMTVTDRPVPFPFESRDR